MWLLLISILDITLKIIFLMMRMSIDNVEHYLVKGIVYCKSLICRYLFIECETHTLSYLLFTYLIF